MFLWVIILALLISRTETHGWLIRHGWVKDFDSKFALILSYFAFFTVPPCIELALIQRVFSRD